MTSRKHDDISNQSNVWEIAAWVVAMGIFAPICISFAYYCSSFAQLSEAFLTFAFSAAAVAIGYSLKPSGKPYFSGVSFAALAAAYALFFAAAALRNTYFGAPLLLGGVAAALMSVGYAFFRGKRGARFVGAVGAGLYAYALLALLMPVFDMPLRFLSGISSVEILNLFGADAKLAFFKDADKFILLFGGKTFEVAQQCNGFGLMVSCAILSILLSVPDLGRTALSKAAHVILCILLAYAANIFRILCIVLTSPHIADKNYHIMHESYGYLFFMLALIATWKICMPRKNPSSGR